VDARIQETLRSGVDRGSFSAYNNGITAAAAAVAVRRPGPMHDARRSVEEGMSTFTSAELEYLTGERRLARVATVGKGGTPHVMPVGMWTYNSEHESIDVGGHDFARTKKYRDVERTGRAAIVIDDLASTDPWRPRGIEIRGRAEAIAEPRPLIRIHPERIVSWGIESEAVGVRHSRSVARSDRPKGGAR
jgi:pyridoxamine 5'-phosphate oxidase family protein